MADRLNKKELKLLDSMKQYIDLQPKKEIDVEAMANFFKAPEELIEKIVVSNEGQVLVDKVVNYVPETSSRNKIDLMEVSTDEQYPGFSKVRDKDIDKKEEINSQFLTRLALDKVTYEDALQAHAQSHTIDKMKLFQLQQAKSELIRVIKMMDTFNLLQEKYREQIEVNIDMFDMEEIIQHNKISYEFIQQSMKIVDKFTNDDTLKILIMDNSLEEEKDHMHDIVSGEESLMDASNRKEVRRSAQRLIAGLSNIQDEVKSAEPINEPELTKTPEKRKEAVILEEVEDEEVPLFEQLKNKN